MMLVKNTKNEPIGRVDASHDANGKCFWEATALIWGIGASKHLGTFATIDEAIKEVKKNGRKKLQAYYATV